MGPQRLQIKLCSGCNHILPRTSFYQRANGQVVSRCIECCRRIAKEDAAANPGKVSQRKKNYRAKNQAAISKYMRAYTRRPSNKKRRNKLLKARAKADPIFKLSIALRRSLADKMRLYLAQKAAPSFNLLGCSLPELARHLESLWTPGMTWDNWGRSDGCWHIDHRRPIASFNLAEAAQQRECFHYSNLQPLWCIDNLRKGARTNEGMCGV
jgi:hypothetical protein